MKQKIDGRAEGQRGRGTEENLDLFSDQPPHPSTPMHLCNPASWMPDLSCSQGLIAGVDEVGRGALFGPVVAAAVILPLSAADELASMMGGCIKDSKKLSSTKRQKLSAHIQKVALAWKIGCADHHEIDRLNIFHASLLAMKRAVLGLQVQPELCLVDGKWLIPDLSMPQLTLVKGDERSLPIAAASILAKVWRDELIAGLATKHAVYDLVNNKGYGTIRHLEALQQYGPSLLHRMSFSPCRAALISNSVD